MSSSDHKRVVIFKVALEHVFIGSGKRGVLAL
jgi:hypothetical protein